MATKDSKLEAIALARVSDVNADSPANAVLAVMVTYNPDLVALREAVTALNNQNCEVVLVDNASVNQSKISECDLNAQLILNQSNLGLGAAHNQGLKLAQERGFEYLLIMDQDSLPLDGMVEQLCAAYQTQSSVCKVSAVGACYLNADNNSESFFVRFGALKFQRKYVNDGIVEADFLISSGSVFGVKALQAIGGMDEGLFIDHVDTEWFLRARNLGYKAFGVGSARMRHGLGEETHQLKLGARQRNVPQHKPFRYYYIFRNSVVLYKRSYTSWLWKWNDLQRLGMIFIMFGLVKAPRLRNLKMMLLGLWHGVLGKLGKVQLPVE